MQLLDLVQLFCAIKGRPGWLPLLEVIIGLFVCATTRKPGKVVLSQDKVKSAPLLEKLSVGAPTLPPVARMEPLVTRLSTQLIPPGRGGKLVEAKEPS